MLQRRFVHFCCLISVLMWSSRGFSLEASALAPPKSILLSQFDADESYDPFADYSEFDGAQEEEEDINFFRNGRFVSLALLVGYRGFTEVLGSLVGGGIDYGIAFTYFFDLRFALQFSFTASDHRMSFSDPNTPTLPPYTGDVSVQNFGFDLKYYVNTQNVTKGLAKFNPYILLGFAYIFRTTQVASTSAIGKDSAPAFDIGGGIEWPLMRNKMFWGLQAMYQQVSFPDSNTPLTTAASLGQNTGITPHGSTYTANLVLGINF